MIESSLNIDSFDPTLNLKLVSIKQLLPFGELFKCIYDNGDYLVNSKELFNSPLLMPLFCFRDYLEDYSSEFNILYQIPQEDIAHLKTRESYADFINFETYLKKLCLRDAKTIPTGYVKLGRQLGLNVDTNDIRSKSEYCSSVSTIVYSDEFNRYLNYSYFIKFFNINKTLAILPSGQFQINGISYRIDKKGQEIDIHFAPHGFNINDYSVYIWGSLKHGKSSINRLTRIRDIVEQLCIWGVKVPSELWEIVQ